MSIKWMLVAVICALEAGNAAAQGSNSYANMLGTIQMQNQTWNNQLNSYNKQFGSAAHAATQSGQLSSQPGAAAATQQSAPLPQYPITATDFHPPSGRLMPDQLASQQAGATSEQKMFLRGSYYQFLEDFEKTNRKDNMAAALTYIVNMSVRAVYSKELSQTEINQLGWNFNSVLAMNPQFVTMPPHDKQVLYESLVITGGTIATLQAKAIQENNPAAQGEAKKLGQMVLKQWLNI